MRVMDRYLAKTVISAILLIILILLGLDLFITLAAELDDLGKGEYGLLKAIQFVLLALPQQVYQLFPPAGLLGCLLGLGLLNSRSELVVMRAVGMSMWRLTWAVARAGVLVILVVTVLGEWVGPHSMHVAKTVKALAKSSGQALATPHGLWIRVDDNFIHIRSVLSSKRLQGITRYHFDGEQHLQLASYAKTAHFEDGHWVLHDVSRSLISSTGVSSEQVENVVWDIDLDPTVLSVAMTKPEEMTLHKLRTYVEYLEDNDLESNRYDLAFWNRVLQPLASLVMMLLAIPFILGPLRSSTLGLRLLAGVILGFGFYLTNAFFGPLSLVYRFPPLLAALLPIVLFGGIGIVLVARD